MNTRNPGKARVPRRYQDLTDLHIERRDKLNGQRRIVDFSFFLQAIQAYIEDEDEDTVIQRLVEGQFVETGWAYFRRKQRETAQELIADARALANRSDVLALRQRLLLAERERELRPLTATLDAIIKHQRWYIEQLSAQEKLLAEKFLSGYRNRFSIKLGREVPPEDEILAASYLKKENPA